MKRKKEYNRDKKTERGINSKPAQQAQDNYDFGEDFWTSVNPEQITTEKKQDNEEELKDINAFDF